MTPQSCSFGNHGGAGLIGHRDWEHALARAKLIDRAPSARPCVVIMNHDHPAGRDSRIEEFQARHRGLEKIRVEMHECELYPLGFGCDGSGEAAGVSDDVAAGLDGTHYGLHAGISEMARLCRFLDLAFIEAAEGVEKVQCALWGILMNEPRGESSVNSQLGEITSHLPHDHVAEQKHKHIRS